MSTHSLIRDQVSGIVPLVIDYLAAASFPYLKARPLTFALIAANLLLVSRRMALGLRTESFSNVYALKWRKLSAPVRR